MRGEGHADRVAVTAAIDSFYAGRVNRVVNNLVRRDVVGGVGREGAQDVVQVEIVPEYARVRPVGAVGTADALSGPGRGRTRTGHAGQPL